MSVLNNEYCPKLVEPNTDRPRAICCPGVFLSVFSFILERNMENIALHDSVSYCNSGEDSRDLFLGLSSPSSGIIKLVQSYTSTSSKRA